MLWGPVSHVCAVDHKHKHMSIIHTYRKYKTHEISKLKCFSSHLVVVFTQSVEAIC